MIITITLLHQLIFMFNTFHTSLMTVTLPQAKRYTSCPFSFPHDHHTSAPTEKPPKDCHISWQLSHLPTPPYTPLITITPLHPLTPPRWPSHLSINWHSFLIPFTAPRWLSHFLSSDAPPHDHHTSPPTKKPPVTLPDNCHTFPHLLVPPS